MKNYNRANKERATKEHKSSWLFSKKMVVAILLVVIFIVYNFLRVDNYKESKNKELADLKQEMHILSEEVRSLEYSLDIVNTLDFVEETARKDLGLVKPGEILYIAIEREEGNQDESATD